jgi:hypothetical protein
MVTRVVIESYIFMSAAVKGKMKSDVIQFLYLIRDWVDFDGYTSLGG